MLTAFNRWMQDDGWFCMPFFFLCIICAPVIEENIAADCKYYRDEDQTLLLTFIDF